jgi:hypothetical protein
MGPPDPGGPIAPVRQRNQGRRGPTPARPIFVLDGTTAGAPRARSARAEGVTALVLPAVWDRLNLLDFGLARIPPRRVADLGWVPVRGRGSIPRAPDGRRVGRRTTDGGAPVGRSDESKETPD